MTLRSPLTLIASASLIALTTAAISHAHPGKTNASGCHNDRIHGGYHCHGSAAMPQARGATDTGAGDNLSSTAIVLSVGDGDTFRVRQNQQTLTVRLACVDAPERLQLPFGGQATVRLKQLLPTGQNVQLRQVDTDRYGRTVAEVFVADRSVNRTLIQEGLAVVYRRYLNSCNANQYLRDEAEAKGQGRAFWSQSNPTMPWDFRRAKRSSR